MLRRELSIVFFTRLTWLVAAAAALLIGHGFVLAVDLFSAGARSVEAGGLMAREYDPLLGIVRPTLGGLYIAASILGPILAARPIGVEHERRSLRVLLLHCAAPGRLLCAKYAAALASCGLLLLCVLPPFLFFRAVGGHIAIPETAVAILGHVLHILLIVALGTAAAAWTGTVAQASAVALLLVLGSWAIDAADGFAALAWLGPAAEWSISAHLLAFERGVLSLGSCAWLVTAAAGALLVAYGGLRFDWPAGRRAAFILLSIAAAGLLMQRAARAPLAFDVTEQRRVSLPPGVAEAARGLPAPLSLTVHLDRDDARRRQVESDVISKLRLARPDLQVRYPLDERAVVQEAERQDGYGRIEVCTGTRCLTTYSTSRKELITLLFEAASRPLPEWRPPAYAGYPLIVEGRRRALGLWLSYGLVPGVFVMVGLWVTRRRRR